MSEVLQLLPLQDLHEAEGARFGAFAGWNMPVSYPKGVMAEHIHTRQQVGVFDISHMKLISIEGDYAADLINHACPIDVNALNDGQSKYTVFLTEDAGIIDDLIVTRLGAERFMIVANAGNAADDIKHLNNLAIGLEVKVEPLERVFLAIQGPHAEEMLNSIGLNARDLLFMQGFEPHPGWFMTRSGYTGEDGFEIGLPEQDARRLLEKIFVSKSATWIGLAARDSLRLEAGLCLHGADITPKTDPVSAALMWAIPKSVRSEGRFVGADALRRIITDGAKQKRVGLKPEGRQPVRSGAPLFDERGRQIGMVTSGSFGPTVEHPISMGYLPTEMTNIGTRVYAHVRGSQVPLVVHSLPFTQHNYRKG